MRCVVCIIIWFCLGIPVSVNSVAAITKKTVSISMRDGTKLSTDIYRQETVAGKMPVILFRTNTNKEAIGLFAYFFAGKGYVVAVQDVRGRFASEGRWEPFIHESEDGYDTIEWLAEQPWSDGNIGMLGGSYMATVQCLTAKLHPPHLKTIIPYCLPADPFRNAPWENGIFLLAPEAWWVSLMNSGIKDFNDPKVIRESQLIKEDKNLYSLPLIEADRKLFGEEVDYWRKWLTNNLENSYWKNASYINELKDIKIPVLLQSGWYDTHLIGTRMAWKSLTESESEFIKLVIGPWNHANIIPRFYASTRKTGPEGNIDLTNLYLRWFDRWLKGIENGIDKEKPVSIFVMNDNKWIHTDKYPLAGTDKIIYLGSKNRANSLKGDGKISWDLPGSGKTKDSFIYNPGNPAPAFIYRNSNGRKIADSIMTSREDILVYESEPAETSYTISGDLVASIYASSSCRDTDWFVYLYGVADNGEYFPLTHGCIRARFRNSFSDPEFIKRRKIYLYDIVMWPTSIKIEKGWKLRVEISSSDFPQYSRNLNNGKENETMEKYKVARQKIFYKRGKASCIKIPIICMD